MTNEMEKKLDALLANPDEINTVFVDSPEQTLANLSERGIEMSREEFDELCAGIMAGMGISTDGELSEDDLENVSGGFIGTAIVGGACLVIGLAAYSYYKGVSNGVKDATNGNCRKAGGGLIYSYGYSKGQAIGSGGACS